MDNSLASSSPELEETAMRIYKDLKDLLKRDDLSPGVRANAVHALANVSQMVNELCLEFEMLYDLGV